MFVHSQRLLLFVAAALAVALQTGVVSEANAALVPAAARAQRRTAARSPVWLSQRNINRQHRFDVVSATDAGTPTPTPTPTESGGDSAFPTMAGVQTVTVTQTQTQTETQVQTQTVTVTATATVTQSGSGGTPAGTPMGTPIGTPAGTPAGTPPGTPAGTPPAGTPTGGNVNPSGTTTGPSTPTSTTGSLATPSPVATVQTGAGTDLILQSNTPNYGYDEVMDDLNNIMSWAGDDGNLTDDEKNEVVAALLSGSARFWPEVPTRVMVRIMLADIRAESDFRPRVVGGPRLDSGSSWGLLQISPGGGSQLLPLYQSHFNAAAHNFSYGIDAPTVRANVRGALIDWETGKQIDAAGLTANDLFRPWVNIHVAMWIQSNLARTSSNDPYWWQQLNSYSWGLKIEQKVNKIQPSSTELSKYSQLLRGAGLARSPRTALGSWVAGAATNGDGSYTSSGDDVSAQYLKAIMKSVSFLYNGASGAQWSPNWLDRWTVNAGLTDYK